MGISPYPSVITMPKIDKPYPSILTFLCGRFPAVPAEVWKQRLLNGTVRDEHDEPLTTDSYYAPHKRLFYFREAPSEPLIPFAETILAIDDHILVACKPHFLPVTPTGPYVNECLLYRLRARTGITDLAPLHRIDRETAGLVIFSVNRKSRGTYGALFRDGHIDKSYQALAACQTSQEPASWRIENRMGQGEPWFRMKTVPGTINARSDIDLVETRGNLARFILRPHTGKTHQLRLHMSSIGFGILNDRYYPELQAERADNFAAPLQLLATTLRFRDPFTGGEREYASQRRLLW